MNNLSQPTDSYIQQGFQAYAAPAKLNLFLHVLGRRADGYHLLQSVFQLIDLQDTIYLKLRQDGHIQQHSTIPHTTPDNDLCVRAAKRLQSHCGIQAGVDIAVDKRIPIGAGLGGGSSDAATVLMALNQLWQCGLSRAELMQLGLALGADVPFFIFGQNAWVEGVGELLSPIALPSHPFLILTPQIHVSTAEIFQSKQLTRDTNPTTIAAFLQASQLAASQSEPRRRPLSHENAPPFRNDLSAVVCQRYPAVQACLDFLTPFGDARMSGSGASVFLMRPLSDHQHHQAAFADIAIPSQLAGVTVFSCAAFGLSQHPLYNLLA